MSKTIFLTVFFTIHFLVNLYIYSRGVQALEQHKSLIPWLTAIMILLFISYPLGRWLDSNWYSPLSVTLHWTGAFWFAGMLYFVMALVGIDIVRGFDKLLHFLPERESLAYIKLKSITGLVTALVVVTTIVWGHINAWFPEIVKHNITVDKKAGNHKSLKIIALSDIHLGTIIGPRKTQKLVTEVNSLKPDIILLVGDVIDEDVKPVIDQNLGEALSKLSAPLGIWAVPGNHEYIGGAEAAIDYLTKHDINILRDEVAFIDSSFYIVGRDDKAKDMFAGQKRQTITRLMADVDTGYPVIVLNHQPHDFDETAATGADFHLSGHTHYGQLWPLGYITDKVFELAHGYMKKGNTHFIVSTGYGTWGPPVRTGNRPEIIEINLTIGN